MKIEMWAIRHIPTGNYLPMFGGTYSEPKPVKFSRLPRIFETRIKASRSLNCWLKGIYGATNEDGSSYWTGTITPVPSRKAEDMEIVPIFMELP